MNNLKDLQYFFFFNSKAVFNSSPVYCFLYERFERWEADEKLKTCKMLGEFSSEDGGEVFCVTPVPTVW